MARSGCGLSAPHMRNRRNGMGIIIWLVVGGIVGWLASIIMRTNAQQGLLLNIVVGIVGAVIGGLIFGRGNINNAGLSVSTFLVSLLGLALTACLWFTYFGQDDTRAEAALTKATTGRR